MTFLLNNATGTILGSLKKLWQDDNRRFWRNTAFKSDAVFIGWQKTPSGKHVALYSVTAEEHPLYRSTVSEQTLRQNHLQVPRTPAQMAKSADTDHQQ